MDIDTFDKDTSVEVEVKVVDINLGSVWISNDEMIVREIVFDMGHSNDKMSKNKWTLKVYDKVDSYWVTIYRRTFHLNVTIKIILLCTYNYYVILGIQEYCDILRIFNML